MTDQLDISLNRLLRGISTDSVDTVRKAWRELLDSRDLATPIVQNKLASTDWTATPCGPNSIYLGLLLALLHELDTQTFTDEIERLRASRLHVLHRRTVELLSNRCGEHPYGQINKQVPVYFSGEVTQPDLVFSDLQRWSQTRGLAISSITRIDVIVRRPDMDYLGLYRLYFDAIILTWRNDTHTQA